MTRQIFSVAQIPSQAMFSPKRAAHYLGINVKTLKQLTDLGEIPTYRFRNRRAYLLEDLETFRKNMPRW
jgi:excisionase family DNA binding protein